MAGSTAISHSFFAKNNLTLDVTPQSLETQLGWFNKHLEAQGCKGAETRSQCDEAVKDALFWVGEIGANDYAYTIGSSVSSSTIQQLAIESVTGFLQVINEALVFYYLSALHNNIIDSKMVFTLASSSSVFSY